MLKTIPLPLKTMQQTLLSNPSGGFLNLEAEKTWKMIKNVNFFLKNAIFVQKNAKIRDVKILKKFDRYSKILSHPRGGYLAFQVG